jgi:uridine kinase
MAGVTKYEGGSAARSHVVEQLADRITGIQLPHPTRVGFDGIETSGKTSLADELSQVIVSRGRPVIRALGDNFRNPREVRYSQGRFSPRGYYEDSVDNNTLLGSLLNPLGPDGTRSYRAASYDSKTDRLLNLPEQTAPEDAVILVDGLFLFRPELVGSFDYRVLVDVSFEEAVRRATERDTHFGSEKDIRELFDRRFHPAQRDYRERVQPHLLAHAIVDNNDLSQPLLLFAKEYNRFIYLL